MTLNTASVAPCHKAQTLETKLDTRKESNWDALQSHGHLGLAVRIVVVDLVIIVFNFRFILLQVFCSMFWPYFRLIQKGWLVASIRLLELFLDCVPSTLYLNIYLGISSRSQKSMRLLRLFVENYNPWTNSCLCHSQLSENLMRLMISLSGITLGIPNEGKCLRYLMILFTWQEKYWILEYWGLINNRCSCLFWNWNTIGGNK